jgi:hypothetical protein
LLFSYRSLEIMHFLDVQAVALYYLLIVRKTACA